MSDVARLDAEIAATFATLEAELGQIQEALNKPEPDLSAQVAAIAELRTRIAGIIPDEVPPAEPIE